MKQLLFTLYNLLLILVLPLFLVWMSISFLIGHKRKTGFIYKLFPFLNIGINTPDFKNGIWIHAVSLGELKAATNFIDLILKEIKKPILLSVVTKTGYEYARTYYGNDKSNVYIFYFPYDFYFSVRPFIDIIKPILFISIETEIWPNLFNMLKNRNIPISIANARISDKSYRNYSASAFFFKYVFRNINLVLCTSAGYYDKFLRLGVKKENINITGNMKFDLSLSGSIGEIKEKSVNLKSILKDNRIIAAGSTHKEEEKFVLDAFVRLNQKDKNIILFIAPRHPERFENVYNLIKNYNLECYRLSHIYATKYRPEPASVNGSENIAPEELCGGSVVLVDIIGELMTIYNITDVAFIGGSMVQAGGHNMLEPLFFGKPVVFGKYVENFSEIAGKIIGIKAGKIVLSPEELFDALSYYLYDKAAAKAAQESGSGLILQNKGSSLKNLEHIIGLLNARLKN